MLTYKRLNKKLGWTKKLGITGISYAPYLPHKRTGGLLPREVFRILGTPSDHDGPTDPGELVKLAKYAPFAGNGTIGSVLDKAERDDVNLEEIYAAAVRCARAWNP